MAAGVAVVATVGALMVLPSRSGSDRPSASAPAPGLKAADPSAITLSERDVAVVVQVYEPGHDSGWHTHPGIHAVAVLSGALTVYDGDCQATTYGPGRPYVGGRDVHLVRNESSVPAELSVTYLSPSAPGESTQHLAAPAGCVVTG
jgi:quercetin dioxygenase-like cupin family protein